MGFATIVGAIAFALMFSAMVVFMVAVEKNIATQAQEQAQASARTRVQEASALAITSAGYGVNQVVDWIDDAYADWNGTFVQTQDASPGTVTLAGSAPYTQNGTYTSEVIDSGIAATNYTTLRWTAVLPAGTQLLFQVRAAASPAALASAAFTGPDGSANTYYTVSGANLNDTVVDGNEYLQYRVNLTTTDSTSTPQLQQVRVGVQRDEGVTTLAVGNTGSVALPYADTDVYLAGTRLPRNTTSRTLDRSATSDQSLWQPGETVTVYAFGDRTTPFAAVVADGAARAATTVS